LVNSPWLKVYAFINNNPYFILVFTEKSSWPSQGYPPETLINTSFYDFFKSFGMMFYIQELFFRAVTTAVSLHCEHSK
jgi:hypothetical protein